METLDQDALNLTKAIRQSESGGNFTAKGKSGEYGAYQFTEPTWNTQAGKYGIKTPLKNASREEQNQVAYKQIKEWKDKGHNVGQIASMWNAGQGEPDAYTGKFSTGKPSVGKNKFGVQFDVPAYAKSVAETYHKIRQGNEPGLDSKNPSSIKKRSTFSESVQGIDTEPQSLPQAEKPSVIGSLKEGKIGDAAYNAMNALTQPFVGLAAAPVQGIAKALGQEDPYKKGLLNKGDAPVEVSNLDVGSKAKDLLHASETTAAVATAGGLVNALRSASALTSPAVKTAMGKFKMPMSEFKSLSSAEKLNALSEALKGATPSDTLVLKKAIEEITPLAAKELGLTPGLLKRALATGSTALKGLLKQGVGYSIGMGVGSKAEEIYRGLTK